MKIKLTRGCIVKGKPQKKDATVEVSNADGKYLISVGAAVVVGQAKTEAK